MGNRLIKIDYECPACGDEGYKMWPALDRNAFIFECEDCATALVAYTRVTAVITSFHKVGKIYGTSD